ncbi:class IV adenylate cyclase [Halorubrum sp. Boch-26]|uniref:class IV adenylate cyclase n=1 Tax=Halorubrum sp. Boch-26 TaxID=2994426 RepID=UPI002469955B|nr:class IV adenylate cyclase [Halorubrum sp. Boch-26]
MFEVEIKVPADVGAVRDRLREVGAERVDARRQRDAYYDAPHRDFAETDEALRMRRETPLPDGVGSAGARSGESGKSEPETTKITYKGPLLDEGSKTRAEHETEVVDPEATAGILSGLGFEPAATVEKRREFWAYDGYTVTLDAVDGLGEFVEIERAVDDESAIEAVRDDALATLEGLGLDGGEQVRTSYLGLLLADGDASDDE